MKKQELYYLIDQYKQGKYDIKTFVEVFEQIFISKELREQMPKKEWDIWNELMTKIERFSPYEEDLLKYPDLYFNESEIKNEIVKTEQELTNLGIRRIL